MKLLREIYEDVDYLIEEDKKTGGKDYYIHGVFMQAEVKNRNGRIYPMKVLEKEYKRYLKEKVNNRNAYGELDHPNTPTVNLQNWSHLITELEQDGKNFVGKARIANTPNGKIVQEMIKMEALVGVSSRGLGTLSEGKGAKIVNDNFYLVTAADIVADPSAPEAYVDALMEGADWTLDPISGEWKAEFQESQIRQVEDAVRRTPKDTSERQDEVLRIFENFLEEVKLKNSITILQNNQFYK